jgi:hypothetical protein
VTIPYTPPRFEEHLGLVHLQAKAGHKMAMTNGANLEYSDCFQEASIAFLMAANGYDPECGYKFSAYYTKVAFTQFRKAIGQLTGVKNLSVKQRAEIQERTDENLRRRAAGEEALDAMQYGLRPMAFSQIGTIEDGTPFEETLMSEAPSPEELLEAKETVEHAAAALSPLAKLVVEWLRDPPPELVRELNAQVAYADRCVEKGARAANYSRRGLTVDAIGRFLQLAGVNVEDRLPMVKAELDRLVANVEAA